MCKPIAPTPHHLSRENCHRTGSEALELHMLTGVLTQSTCHPVRSESQESDAAYATARQ